MPKRSSKQGSKEANETAHRIVSESVGDSKKNPAAVELGRLGGLKGGKARAAKLSKKERSDIARRAAQARWGKR